MTGQPTETSSGCPRSSARSCRRSCRRSRGSTRGTCRASCATRSARCSWTGSSRSASPVSWARSCSSTRAGSSRSARAATRSSRHAIGSAGVDVAIEVRNGSWFNEKNVDRTLRFLEDNKLPFVMVDGATGLQEQHPAHRRGHLARPRAGPIPRPPHRDLGGEGTSRPSSASATSTTATSSRSGRRASATQPRRLARRTCS